MAKGFTSVKKTTGSDKVSDYKMIMGEQSVRLFGSVLTRYVYWLDIKGSGPIECLQYNREDESWDNKAYDPVKDMYPDLKPNWAYSMLCFDSNDNILIFNFKKKLYEQILENLEDLGDPADPEEGYELIFTKKKTGPKAINVEYSLLPMKCQKAKRPLTEKQRELIAGSKTIEELLPRPEKEDIAKYLDKLTKGNADEVDENLEEELTAE